MVDVEISVGSTSFSQGTVKPRRRRSILREFSFNTSTHGIADIARSQSWSNRLFWSTAFLISLGVVIYFIIQTILSYFKYPTQTLVSIDDEWPQYYPAFTICNLSPIRYDRFYESFLKQFNETSNINITDADSFWKHQKSRIEQFFQMKINRNESLDAYFFPLSSMLIKCVFNGEPCSTKDFINFTSPSYGMCYTFNAKLKNVKNSGIRYSHENGGHGTLDLQLYIHSNQYVPHVTEAVGLIAIVHDNTQLPRVDVAGLELAPGFRHRLNYRKKIYAFQPPPYSTCTDDIPLGLQAIFQHYQGADYSYSEGICMRACIQAHNYDRCGCVDPNEWDARFVVPRGTNEIILAPLCNVSDICYLEATEQLVINANVMNAYCSMCTSRCRTTQFLVQTSSSRAPPRWMLEEIKNFVENNSSIPLPETWSTEWQRHIHENFLSVELIREAVSVENYAQEATLDFLNVISNIGGQTGLWIGMSFLSLLQLLEMLYRMVRLQCNRIRHRLREKRNT